MQFILNGNVEYIRIYRAGESLKKRITFLEFTVPANQRSVENTRSVIR